MVDLIDVNDVKTWKLQFGQNEMPFENYLIMKAKNIIEVKHILHKGW